MPASAVSVRGARFALRIAVLPNGFGNRVGALSDFGFKNRRYSSFFDLYYYPLLSIV